MLRESVVYSFGYDSAGRLATVTDVDGLVTTIERDVNGQPMKIAGPYGAETLLAVDGNGYLATIENPALESWTATYHAGGLLATLSDPCCAPARSRSSR